MNSYREPVVGAAAPGYGRGVKQVGEGNLARRAVRSGSLTDVLNTLEQQLGDNDARHSVGDTLKLFGTRAYGPLLLLTGLLSISPLTIVPGLTWGFAVLALAVALQMVFFREAPWLPRGVLGVEVPEGGMRGFIKSLRPFARFVDRLVRPRLTVLTRRPWVALAGLAVAVAALVTFPLGLIPFAPLIPGVTICLIGLALTARDGLVLSVAVLIIGAATWVVTEQLL